MTLSIFFASFLIKSLRISKVKVNKCLTASVNARVSSPYTVRVTASCSMLQTETQLMEDSINAKLL